MSPRRESAIGDPLVCGNPEQSIFVQKKSPDEGGDWSYGTGGSIEVRNRDLNRNCNPGTFDSNSHSVSHLKSPNLINFVEIGWVEWYSVPDIKGWNYFVEAKVGSTIIGGLDYGETIDSPKVFGNYFGRFWMNNLTGTNKFRFYIDEHDNGQQMAVGSDINAGFSYGYAFGETSRKGGSATGVMDHHKRLDTFDCNPAPCRWANWGNNLDPNDPGNNGYDAIPGWHWSHVAQDEYKIVKD